MPTSLALCFDAPMQSWGIRAQGIIRDTATEPSKSGVIGLLAAALGVPRDDDRTVAELARLRLAIRVDREGLLQRDFQTTQNVPTTTGAGHRTVISERYYLADALFLVVLEGEERLLTRLAEVLPRPRWPLFFGRRAFVPARPLIAPSDALTHQPAEQVLRDHPWLVPSAEFRRRRAVPADVDSDPQPGLRTVVDCAPDHPGAEMRQDLPISFTPGQRRFGVRTVLVDEIPLPDARVSAGDGPCT